MFTIPFNYAIFYTEREGFFVKIKKFMLVLLAMIIALSLCACGAEPSAPEENSSASSSEEGETPAEETPSDAEEPVPEAAKLTRGTVSGTVYTNEDAGITYTAPVDWSFASDEEMAEFYGVSLEEIQAIGDRVYGTLCKNEAGENFRVIFEKQPYTRSPKEHLYIFGENIKSGNPESIIDLSVDYIERFGNYTASLIAVVDNGDSYFIEFALAHRIGEYMVLCSSTYHSEESFFAATNALDIKDPSYAPAPLTRGTVDGSTYVNEYADIKFVAPEGWVYCDDEELASRYGITVEELNNYSDTRMVFGMMCENPETGETADFSLEKKVEGMTLFEFVAYTEQSLYSAYPEGSGMKVVLTSISDFEYIQKKLPVINVQIDVNNGEYSVKQMVIIGETEDHWSIFSIKTAQNSNKTKILQGLSYCYLE